MTAYERCKLQSTLVSEASALRTRLPIRRDRFTASTQPLHAFARLFKGYVLKAGFLDGAVGWVVA